MTAFPVLYYDGIMTENNTGATIDDGTGDVSLPNNITASGTATFGGMIVGGNVTFSGSVQLGSPTFVRGINTQSVELVDTVGGGSAIRGRVVQDSTNNGYVRLESYNSGQNLQGYVEVSGDGYVEALDASGNGIRFDTTNGSISVVGAPSKVTFENDVLLNSSVIEFAENGIAIYGANDDLNISFNGDRVYAFPNDDVAQFGDHVINKRNGDSLYAGLDATQNAFEALRNSSNGDKVDAAIAALQPVP